MKLSKNVIKILIFAGLALVVFNVIAFAVPFSKTGAFWVSYAFGMIAIISQIAVMKLAFNGAESVKSKFYGFPIARIGVIYGVCQVLLSIAEMILAFIMPLWIPLVLFTVIFAAAAAGMIAADTVRDEIEKQDVEIEKGVGVMRDLQSKVNLLTAETNCGEAVLAAVKELSEEIKYSDPVSNTATKEIELELTIQIDELRKSIWTGNEKSSLEICSRAKSILAERNRLCKLNKNSK